MSVGISTLVPKPGTPFARLPMAAEREVRRKLEVIKQALRGHAEFTAESTRWSYWQAVLARGGRELAAPLAAIAQANDAPSTWEAAFREHGLNANRYALEAIPPDAPLPWAHIGQRGCE